MYVFKSRIWILVVPHTRHVLGFFGTKGYWILQNGLFEFVFRRARLHVRSVGILKVLEIAWPNRTFLSYASFLGRSVFTSMDPPLNKTESSVSYWVTLIIMPHRRKIVAYEVGQKGASLTFSHDNVPPALANLFCLISAWARIVFTSLYSILCCRAALWSWKWTGIASPVYLISLRIVWGVGNWAGLIRSLLIFREYGYLLGPWNWKLFWDVELGFNGHSVAIDSPSFGFVGRSVNIRLC